MIDAGLSCLEWTLSSASAFATSISILESSFLCCNINSSISIACRLLKVAASTAKAAFLAEAFNLELAHELAFEGLELATYFFDLCDDTLETLPSLLIESSGWRLVEISLRSLDCADWSHISIFLIISEAIHSTLTQYLLESRMSISSMSSAWYLSWATNFLNDNSNSTTFDLTSSKFYVSFIRSISSFSFFITAPLAMDLDFVNWRILSDLVPSLSIVKWSISTARQSSNANVCRNKGLFIVLLRSSISDLQSSSVDIRLRSDNDLVRKLFCDIHRSLALIDRVVSLSYLIISHEMTQCPILSLHIHCPIRAQIGCYKTDDYKNEWL